MISSPAGVSRYVKGEKSEKNPFLPILVVAAAPEQDNGNDDNPATIILEEIIKASTHCVFPPLCLFALSYEGWQEGVTERKNYG